MFSKTPNQGLNLGYVYEKAGNKPLHRVCMAGDHALSPYVKKASEENLSNLRCC